MRMATLESFKSAIQFAKEFTQNFSNKISKRALVGIGLALWGVLFFIPLTSAIVATILPSLGYEPLLSEHELTLQYWQEFLTNPLFQKSILTTLYIGWGSAIIALIGSFAISALLYSYARQLIKWLAVVLAIPHAAFALGFSFLVAPSGFFVRIFEKLLNTEALSGFNNPLLFLDHWGISLGIVLVLKEIPFLTFIILGSVKNYEVETLLITLKSLGYSKFAAWRRVIVPIMYKRIRLTFFIILAYSLSVVDMSIIIGPQQPATLSVLLVQLYTSGDTAMRFLAYTGGIFLGLLIVGSILLSVGIEKLWHRLRLIRLSTGRRWSLFDGLFRLGAWGTVVMATSITVLSIAVNLLWSFSEKWRYPNLLPTAYSFKYWKRALLPDGFELSESLDALYTINAASIMNREWLHALLSFPLSSTLFIGFLSACSALVVSLVFLEAGRFFKDNVFFRGLYGSFFIPLLVPETILLFGVTFFAIYLSFNENFLTLSWAHFLYTFPYLMLTLRGPYHAYDERYSTIGRALSGRNFKTFFRIKLPILLRSIAMALAIAFSVSVAQYLSTELIGGGRLVTITTEAVNLSAGLNRRIIGVYAVLQMAIPMAAFLLVFYAFRSLEDGTRARDR